MPIAIGPGGGIPLIFSVIEFVVAFGGFLLIYDTYRSARAASLKNAAIAFLVLSIAALGILLRRALYVGVEPPVYAYITDFGYMFASVLLYKALSK